MNREKLIEELKQLVVQECDISGTVDDIIATAPLIGEQSQWDLDSLDALTIALEVKSRYGKHIDSGNETRLALRSIDSLADFILAD